MVIVNSRMVAGLCVGGVECHHVCRNKFKKLTFSLNVMEQITFQELLPKP